MAKVGERVTMTVEVTGTPDPVVTWYKDNQQILGAVPGGPFRTKIQGNSYSLIIEKGKTVVMCFIIYYFRSLSGTEILGALIFVSETVKDC
jgi:hypothetical protein